MKEISVTDIDPIFEAVRDREGSVDIEREGGTVELTSGPKLLEISEDGKVKGSMPLHSFETSSAESVEVQPDKIKVHFENGVYIFHI